MAERCDTTDIVEYLMPKFKFKEGFTDNMLKQLNELPPKMRQRIMDSRFSVNMELATELITDTNPQRVKAHLGSRTWKDTEEKVAQNPLLYDLLVQNKGKGEAYNSEEMLAVQIGMTERAMDLAKNAKPLAQMLMAKDKQAQNAAMEELMTTANTMLALMYKGRGALSEAGRTLNFAKRFHQLQKEAKGLETLFGTVGC